MTATPSGDTTARRLLRQAEAIAQLRREVESLAEETTETIANLILRMETVEDTTSHAPEFTTATSWCWRGIGEHAEAALWEELRDWVGWIRHRYPLARKIPECWDEHPELVEELTALWLAWQAAYVERDACLTAAADWHDRWLPGLLHRMQHGIFALDCLQGRHSNRPGSCYSE